MLWHLYRSLLSITQDEFSSLTSVLSRALRGRFQNLHCSHGAQLWTAGSLAVPVWHPVAGAVCAAGGCTAMGCCGWNWRSASAHTHVACTFFLLSAAATAQLLLLLSALQQSLWLLLLRRQWAGMSEVASVAEDCDVCMTKKWCKLYFPNSLALISDIPPWAPVAPAAACNWTATSDCSEWPEKHARSWRVKNTERCQYPKARSLVTHT